MMNVRNALIGFIVSAVLVGVASCGGGGGSDNSAPAAMVIRSASLTGAQETPPTGATGTGRGAVVVNPTTLEITGGITFTGLTSTPPSAQHIHQAPSGNPTGSGAPIISLTLAPDNATATVPAGTFLTNAQYAALLAGELYFNVHTSPANPNGEIRGQINIQGGVTAGLATLNGAQESSTNTSTAIGRGTIVVNSTSPYDILICYVTHSVTNTTVAHIHTGAPGVSGPANVVTLTQGTNIYTAPVAAASTPPTALTTQNFADFMAGNTYFNVHSSNTAFCAPNASCSGGEIRGQILIQ